MESLQQGAHWVRDLPDRHQFLEALTLEYAPVTLAERKIIASLPVGRRPSRLKVRLADLQTFHTWLDTIQIKITTVQQIQRLDGHAALFKEKEIVAKLRRK
jgi:hypothetical protein